MRPIFPEGPVDLILRVLGHHILRIKTENEVAVMMWLRKNTTIAVPEVVQFDVMFNNVLQHEFTLLERVRGTTLHEIYDRLSQEQLEQGCQSSHRYLDCIVALGMESRN